MVKDKLFELRFINGIALCPSCRRKMKVSSTNYGKFKNVWECENDECDVIEVKIKRYYPETWKYIYSKIPLNGVHRVLGRVIRASRPLNR